MPNHLVRSKRRQSLAEHEAVVTALSEIALREDAAVMALSRRAARQLVREKVAAPDIGLRGLVLTKAPKMPARFKTAAQVARFKRATCASSTKCCSDRGAALRAWRLQRAAARAGLYGRVGQSAGTAA